jgi:hypothetical protein
MAPRGSLPALRPASYHRLGDYSVQKDGTFPPGNTDEGLLFLSSNNAIGGREPEVAKVIANFCAGVLIIGGPTPPATVSWATRSSPTAGWA